MAPLGHAETARLIEDYQQLVAKQAEIGAVLASLPRSWAEGAGGAERATAPHPLTL